MWRSYTISLIALCLWREARNQPDEAITEVGCVIRKRAQRPSWWGRGWCGVIAQKYQFSSMTDPKDPQLTLWPLPGDTSFERCLRIALQVYTGEARPKFPGADSYHDDSIAAPSWAHPVAFVGTIGRLRFFDSDKFLKPSEPKTA